MSPFSRPSVKRWMEAVADEYRDLRVGELNLTALCEGAAAEWGQDEEGGPLDDPDHWIWEVAAEVAEGDDEHMASMP